MKDFVREYWKTAAAGAAGAFLLSLLVGLVTRNPFGVVLLRALLLAILFAGLAAVLRYLIRTRLQEVVPQGAFGNAGRGDTRLDRQGGRVDIVLPEENPIGRQHDGTSSQESSHFGTEDGSPSPLGAEMGDDSTILNAGLGESGADQAESEGLGELAEELAEELPAPGDADEVREDAVASSDAVGSATGKTEDRDGLPDISNLEIAEDTSVDARGARKGMRDGGQRPVDALRGAVSEQDPATIAKAIRTVLKREDKG